MKVKVTETPDHKIEWSYEIDGIKNDILGFANSRLEKSKDFSKRFIENIEYDPPSLKTRMLNIGSYMELTSLFIHNDIQHAELDCFLSSLAKEIQKPKSFKIKDIRQWLKDNSFALKGRFNMYSSILFWFIIFSGIGYWISIYPTEYFQNYFHNENLIGFLRYVLVAIFSYTGTSICKFSKQEWGKIKQVSSDTNV